MEKLTVYGLPLNPLSALEQLKGASFCVSYATRDKLTTQLDDAIRLVGEKGMLLVDNGAFSAWRSGVSTMSDDYLDGFEAWAKSIMDRCPQAICVVPDVIDGTEEQNAELVRQWIGADIDSDRMMPVWHLHESIGYLLYLCEGFEHVAFGSSGQYAKPGTPHWHARIKEAFAAIDAWELESEGAYVRPRLHMMRAQSEAHKYPFDSSDSCNLAINHNRQRRVAGETFSAFAGRIDSKIQASAGDAADYQIKRPRGVLYPQSYFELLVEQVREGSLSLADFVSSLGSRISEAEKCLSTLSLAAFAKSPCLSKKRSNTACAITRIRIAISTPAGSSASSKAIKSDAFPTTCSRVAA